MKKKSPGDSTKEERPPQERVFLLDTSALIVFTEDEAGAEVVERVLREAAQGKARVLVSFITFMESYSWILKRGDEEGARDFYLYMTTLPIERVDIDERIIIKAGEILASFPLGMAASWIVASAIERRATLVHRDPAYAQVGHLVPLIGLPDRSE
ncbi:MAG: PIN domain-containing protein [Candidatus Tectomicrobia bacterium]|uniref:PIN domain-containing protein n=1 Tax=Tectimicrobiota bacterium TaxID=2528274 RepID=A0A932CRK5_UNCTE|nr:PIN domain-containing protein [Candidatus Tectomicrobia bacterium]